MTKPKKTRKKITVSGIITWLLLIIVTVICIFPYYLMIVMSSHTHQEISTKLNFWFGSNLLENAKMVWKAGFARFYFNSFYIAVLSAGAAVFICALAGFALAKYKFKGRTAIFNAILATMMLPFGVSIIGYLIEMRVLGLSKTHLPIIISTMCSSYGVYLIMQFMKDGIPNEVLESARIDGASEPKIFIKLALPFSKPACMTLFILLFMNSWNNFLIPLIFINKESMYTVPLGVFSLGNQYSQEYGARMFALAVSTIPLLLLYIFNSKHLVNGITVGAVKG